MPYGQTMCVSGQESSYWAGMLSCVTYTHIKCDRGSVCKRLHGTRSPETSCPCQIFYCPLDARHGAMQSASSVLTNYEADRLECSQCCKSHPGAQMTKRTLFSRAPAVLALFTYSQQVSRFDDTSSNANVIQLAVVLLLLFHHFSSALGFWVLQPPCI